MEGAHGNTKLLTTGVDRSLAPVDVDALLEPYLRAETEEESEHELARLVAQTIVPVVKEIVGYRLRLASSRATRANDEQQREDVCQDTLLRLLPKIHECRTRPDEQAIKDLRGYTAVIAYRACYTYLRRKYPRRHSLKNRLRYLLTRQPGFALWESARSEAIVGYDAWRGVETGGRSAERLARILEEAHDHLPAETLTKECALRRPADLLAAIFDYVGAPVALDDLVNVIAALWEVQERAPAPEDELERLPDLGSETGQGVERREFLRELWVEVLQLPVRQRRALLLNLRDSDGDGCIALLPLTGVATLRRIAAALEMPAERLAELWRRLPLDDLELAEYLSLTRQQVINLRKAARARLARRLKDFL